MALTVLNLEEAVEVYDALCYLNFPDEDIDTIASSVIAKMFDEPIDELLEEWAHVDTSELNSHLQTLVVSNEVEPAVIAIHQLLYELQLNYSHTGSIVRVALMDGRGNLIIQTEDINDDSYNFKRHWQNRIVHYACHQYTGH